MFEVYQGLPIPDDKRHLIPESSYRSNKREITGFKKEIPYKRGNFDKIIEYPAIRLVG